jgi:hypothetical protein
MPDRRVNRTGAMGSRRATRDPSVATAKIGMVIFYAYSVWIASTFRTDIIFEKDRLEQVAKPRQSSLAILRARCQGQTK